MAIRLFMNPVSLFPWPLRLMLPEIAKNFDGIEVLLTPHYDPHWMAQLRRVTKEHEISLHLHELWSCELNPDHFHNRVAAMVGKITWKTEPLSNQLPGRPEEPMVCYPFRHQEIFDGWKSKLWLQTAPVKTRNVSYEDFLKIVCEGNFGVVFDTTHVLELYENAWGVAELGRISEQELNETLLYCWWQLAPYVKEIHFNNFRPQKGFSRGRNCMPNDGVLDLKRFAREVVLSGWQGIVVPEVSPGKMLRLGKPDLKSLAQMVNGMFF